MINEIIKFFNTWKKTIIIFAGITASYFLLRLVNLTILPVFCDEAIYIRWAQVMKAEPTLRFLPLSDGKQPFFMWLVIPFLKFIKDPLFAGRFVSVLAGFGSLLGISFLSFELFKNRKTALLSGFLYAIVPFSVFFDRMALADSLLSMLGIWFLFFSLLLIKNKRLDLAMISGILLGLAYITKSPATFFALMLPATLMFLDFKKSKKEILKDFLTILGLWIIIYGFAFAIYSILRLGPNFQMIALRNQDYVFPITNILTHPLDPFQSHIKDLFGWYFNLLTPLVFIAFIGGLFCLIKNDFKKGLFLMFWLFFPLVAQLEYAKVFTARYVLFSIPIVLIIAAFGLVAAFDFINKLSKTKYIALSILFSLLVIAQPLYYDYLLLTSPEKAPLPRNERSGYFEEWTSGTGIKEAADYLKERAKTGNVLIGTEGYFGTLPDGLQMYLNQIPNITVIGVGVYIDKAPPKLINSLVDNEVYLVINDSRLNLNLQENGLTLISKYPKAVKANGTRESLLLLLVNQSKKQ